MGGTGAAATRREVTPPRSQSGSGRRPFSRCPRTSKTAQSAGFPRLVSRPGPRSGSSSGVWYSLAHRPRFSPEALNLQGTRAGVAALLDVPEAADVCRDTIARFHETRNWTVLWQVLDYVASWLARARETLSSPLFCTATSTNTTRRGEAAPTDRCTTTVSRSFASTSTGPRVDTRRNVDERRRPRRVRHRPTRAKCGVMNATPVEAPTPRPTSGTRCPRPCTSRHGPSCRENPSGVIRCPSVVLEAGPLGTTRIRRSRPREDRTSGLGFEGPRVSAVLNRNFPRRPRATGREFSVIASATSVDVCALHKCTLCVLVGVAVPQMMFRGRRRRDAPGC